MFAFPQQRSKEFACYRISIEPLIAFTCCNTKHVGPKRRLNFKTIQIPCTETSEFSFCHYGSKSIVVLWSNEAKVLFHTRERVLFHFKRFNKTWCGTNMKLIKLSSIFLNLKDFKISIQEFVFK